MLLCSCWEAAHASNRKLAGSVVDSSYTTTLSPKLQQGGFDSKICPGQPLASHPRRRAEAAVGQRPSVWQQGLSLAGFGLRCSGSCAHPLPGGRRDRVWARVSSIPLSGL